ncbi:MAG TPA: hypothetical protein VK702_05970 [Candidatus Acidoferrum sp.]|jgi:hypothetical protein|nr:hypothetical protein [Candidatus Acidoferrum sp.]
MENARSDRRFYGSFAVLVVAAGLWWLLAPTSFWQQYGWLAPWATGVGAGLLAVALWRRYRGGHQRQAASRSSSFLVYGYHVIGFFFTLLLGQTMLRGLSGEALWLAALGYFAFYGAIVVGLAALQRYLDPPRTSADELIDTDPPQEYNVLLMILACIGIPLYFIFVQPKLQHLPGQVQRVIGFLVLVAAYLGAQWFDYRYLRSNGVRSRST